ncbi:MAG: pyridoxamine 5'-phosphate oxidase family protein [Dehalococcoidia bacterium]|nr:pyridoxamine 5'-phosphate oxidase family protein [Dehalococcoidia bacterium]
MSAHSFEQVITSEDEIRAILGYPGQRAADKVIDHIDEHCAALIAHSPFLVISSADSDGNMDMSPKGDPEGFVKVLDDKTLVIPDRLGNRRGDTFSNVLQNPKVGLYFLAPGYRETLRVSGTAQIVRDTALLESMSVQGKIPTLALVISVEKAFFHCAKCVIRSGLWKPESWGSVDGIPTLGEILVSHSNIDEPAEEIQKSIDEAYETRVY